MHQLTQFGSVALGVGSVGEACLNIQAGDTVFFNHLNKRWFLLKVTFIDHLLASLKSIVIPISHNSQKQNAPEAAATVLLGKVDFLR